MNELYYQNQYYKYIVLFNIINNYNYFLMLINIIINY